MDIYGIFLEYLLSGMKNLISGTKIILFYR